MFWDAAKHHSPIAIDLGTANLHAVQLERRGATLIVSGCCELPRNASPQADPATPPASASKTDAWPAIDRSKFVGRDVVVSLNPPEVECSPLRVPENLLKLDHRSLLNAIRHEVGRNISHPVDEVEMDVWKMLPGHMDSPNLMVAAARRQSINQILAWLDGQNLVCRRIDVGPLAALRACARLTNCPSAEQLWGVLDVGMSAVRLYIGVQQTPVYVRCIPRGSEEMTRRISEELGVSLATAESYKRHYGLNKSDGHCRSNATIDDAVDGRRMAGILLGVLRPTLRSISEEIQRSFRYAMGLYPDRPIAGLWVIGGGAALSGFAEALHEMLGVEVHRTGADLLPADVKAPMGWSEQATWSSLAAFGSCLGELN